MRILFLDLDGTMRYSSDPSGFINKPSDVVVYPEAAEQMKRFLEDGWAIAYISNQGGIAAGFTTAQDFSKGVIQTDAQLKSLGVDFSSHLFKERIPILAYCPHAVDAGCICRKPLPGMPVSVISSLSISEEATVDVRECLFVGDRPEDEGCAKACGIPFMWAEDWRAADSKALEKKEA